MAVQRLLQLAVAGTHTKIALIDTDGQKIVIHGSANLRSSRSVESITVETNPVLYDFHMDWSRAVLDHYATIRKSIRASALFDVITQGAEGKAWQKADQADQVAADGAVSQKPPRGARQGRQSGPQGSA